MGTENPFTQTDLKSLILGINSTEFLYTLVISKFKLLKITCQGIGYF